MTCHNGALLTNNLRADVGALGTFKVPSLLGVGAPFMHDGCTVTLADRFGTCGDGEAHGKTSQLDATPLADLTGTPASRRMRFAGRPRGRERLPCCCSALASTHARVMRP